MQATTAWRPAHTVLAAIPLLAVVVLVSFAPMEQPQAYHLFADTRGWLGLPNFGDVVSNLAFVVRAVLASGSA